MTKPPAAADPPVLALLRGARDVYRDAIRQALVDVGCDDVPAGGVLVLVWVGRGSSDAGFTPQADIVSSLGLSKQAASQLIDTLELRAYLERRTDPADRRRMELRLSDRGRLAASAIREAVAEVEAAIAQRLTAQEWRGLRVGLAAYAHIRDGGDG